MFLFHIIVILYSFYRGSSLIERNPISPILVTWSQFAFREDFFLLHVFIHGQAESIHQWYWQKPNTSAKLTSAPQSSLSCIPASLVRLLAMSLLLFFRPSSYFACKVNQIGGILHFKFMNQVPVPLIHRTRKSTLGIHLASYS